MKLFNTLELFFLTAVLIPAVSADHHGNKLYSGEPIKALIITGGCCHNYHYQTSAITEGISKVADVNWTILHEGGTGKDHESEFYSDPNWAKPFDLVIHNECFAQVTNTDYVKQVSDGHKDAGVPGIVIHCAMHTYRDIEADDWRKFLGVTSKRHDHKSNYAVKVVDAKHPAMIGMPKDWVTPLDELYVIEKLWPSATALATSKSEKDGNDYPVVWVNDFEGTRVFGTTYGHSDETFGDPVFINLLVHGFVWAAGKD
jgi:type 1 glutamine amidotransferase